MWHLGASGTRLQLEFSPPRKIPASSAGALPVVLSSVDHGARFELLDLLSLGRPDVPEPGLFELAPLEVGRYVLSSPRRPPEGLSSVPGESRRQPALSLSEEHP